MAVGLSGPEFTLIVADGPTWLGEIDVYESAQIIARYNEVSTWELVLPTSSEAATLILEAARPRLVVTSAPGIVFRSGPVVRLERIVDVDGDMMTVSGVDDMIWLRRRLAHPQPAKAAPPYNGQAFDTRTGPSSQVIAAFIDANAGTSAHMPRRVDGSDRLPTGADGTHLSPSPPVTRIFSIWFRAIAARAGLGVEIRDLDVVIFQPTGPAAVFSQELGTLAGWSHAIESPDVNYVYVAGGGAGAARLIREYADVDSVGSWGRIEEFQDRRDTTATAELDEAGAETLADGIPTPEFELNALDICVSIVPGGLAVRRPGDRLHRRPDHHRRHPRSDHRPSMRMPPGGDTHHRWSTMTTSTRVQTDGPVRPSHPSTGKNRTDRWRRTGPDGTRRSRGPRRSPGRSRTPGSTGTAGHYWRHRDTGSQRGPRTCQVSWVRLAPRTHRDQRGQLGADNATQDHRPRGCG